MPTLVIPDDGKAHIVRVPNAPSNPPGPTGPTGPAGAGVPTGGTTGQVLAKNTNTDNDTHWIDPPAGGGGGTVTTTDTATIDFSGSGTVPSPLSAIVPDGAITVAKLSFDPATQTELNTQGQPTGGTAGQVLSKIDGTNYNSQWVTNPSAPVASVNGRTGAVTGLSEGLTVTAIKTTAYTAAANEFVLCDVSSAGFTVTLPTAPANGTRVGARIVTFTSPNAISFSAAGGDVFNKAGGPTTQIGALVANTTGVTYQYQSGVWSLVASAWPTAVLDGRYTNLTVPSLKTANYTAGTDEYVPCDTSGGGFTVTLPTTPPDGTTCGVKLVTAGNTLTVARGGSDFIGKSGVTTSKTLTGVNQTLWMVYSSSATTWYETTDVRNTVAAGTNITVDAPSNGQVNVNVDPASAALWTPVRVRRTTDSSALVSSTTLQNDTDLVLGTSVLAANTEWEIYLACIYTSDTTADFQWKFTASGAGATFDYWSVGNPHNSFTGSGAASSLASFALTLSSGAQQVGGFGVSTAGVAQIRGYLVVAAAATNLQFQWAQGTSTATNTVVKAGSYMIARRAA